MSNFTINGINIDDKNDFLPENHFTDAESFYRARTDVKEIKAETKSEDINFEWEMRVYGENEVLHSMIGPQFIIDREITAAGKYEIRISHPEEPVFIEKLIELPNFNNTNTDARPPQPSPPRPSPPRPSPPRPSPPQPPSLSSNANLKAIQLNSGRLSPRFNINTLNYMVEVDKSTSTLQVNARKAHRAAEVKINGTTTSNSIINLSSDITIVNILVTAENGNTRNYRVTISKIDDKRTLSSNAQLAELNLNNIKFSPVFSGDHYSYTANVSSEVSVVGIQSKAVESDANIVIDGGQAEKGNVRKRKSLMPGENKISVEVIAPDGKTKQQYRLTIIREEPPMEMLDRAPSRLTVDFSPIPSPVFRSCLENKDLYFLQKEEYSFSFSTIQFQIRNISFRIYSDGPGDLELELRNRRSGDVLWQDTRKVTAVVENNISLVGIGPHLRQSGTYEIIVRPVHNQPGRKLGILNFGNCSGLEFKDESDEVRVRIDQENRIFSKLNFQL